MAYLFENVLVKNFKNNFQVFFLLFQGKEDVTPGLNNLVDLPQEAPISPSGLQFEPILAEIDEDTNKFIFGMKRECSRDQLDYCAGSKYKSGAHTMCKYCVST